jgi:hypothetical protein
VNPLFPELVEKHAGDKIPAPSREGGAMVAEVDRMFTKRDADD